MQNTLNPLSFDGRLNQRSYLITLMLLIAVSLPLSAMIPDIDSPDFAFWATANVVFVIFPIFAAVKRLRDIEKSVWLSLLCLVPLISIVFELWLCLQPSHFDHNERHV